MIKATIKGVFYTGLSVIMAGCYYQNSAYNEPRQAQYSHHSMAYDAHGTSDEMITDQVRGRVMNRGFMGSRNSGQAPVNVMTKNGVVHLSGTVNTPEERSNIIRNASSVRGVKSVKSTIKIGS